MHTMLVYTTQKEFAHRILWNPWSPVLWCLFPPSRQKRLFEERCKKAHAPRMQVFLQANSSGKPQTAGSGVCLLLLGDTPLPPPSPDPTPPVSVPGVTLRVASALIRICWAPPSRRHSRNCDNKGFDSFQCDVCLWARSTVCESRWYIYISLKEISRCCHQASLQFSTAKSHLFHLLLIPQWAGTRRLGFYFLNHKPCRLKIFTRLCHKLYLWDFFQGRRSVSFHQYLNLSYSIAKLLLRKR